MFGPARLGRVFVELADTLRDDFDVIDHLTTLCSYVVELVGADSAGVLLINGTEGLGVAASSNETARFLELFEVQHRGGPCIDCLHQGEAFFNQPLDSSSRWPEFASRANTDGYVLMHAFPMRRGMDVLGAVNVFATDATPIHAERLALAQSLVDAATVGLLQVRSRRDVELVNGQLEEALRSRVVLEQAKGMLSAGHGVDLEAAFEMMRRYARSSGARLADVAQAVVAGTLDPEQLVRDA